MELRHPLIIRTTQRDPTDKNFDFVKSLHKLCSCKTFAELSFALHRLDLLNLPITKTTEISFFKEDSLPMWEHKTNILGAQWSMKFERQIGERLFLKLLLRWIHHKFDTININGIVISSRKYHVFISIWSSNAVSEESIGLVNKEIVRGLRVNFKVKVWCKQSEQSLKDGSTISWKKKIDTKEKLESGNNKEEDIIKNEEINNGIK